MTHQQDIRRAGVEDIAELERLWLALTREQQGVEPDLRFSDDALVRWRADIRGWLRNDDKRIWVVAGNGGLIGFLAAERAYVPLMFEPRLDVFVSELYVDIGHRGRGLGRALLSEAQRWAEEIGAMAVTASVLSANEGGRAFWYAAGAAPFYEAVRISTGLTGDAASHEHRPLGFRSL